MPFVRPIASGGAYNTGLIDQSAWANQGDYQSLTYGTAGNTSRWIWGGWFQRTVFGTIKYLYSAGPLSTVTEDFIGFDSSDRLYIRWFGTTRLVSNRAFRDVRPFHLIVSLNLASSGSAKCAVYFNGEEITSWSTDTRASITSVRFNTATPHRFLSAATAVGDGSSGGCYAAQHFFLDGVSIQNGDYAITDFGSFYTLGDNGQVWTPISDADAEALAAAAGGNSFCLTDEIGDGTDASTNGNDFTPTSMSHAATGPIIRRRTITRSLMCCMKMRAAPFPKAI
jgi:hypothetical protein